MAIILVPFEALNKKKPHMMLDAALLKFNSGPLAVPRNPRSHPEHLPLKVPEVVTFQAIGRFIPVTTASPRAKEVLPINKKLPGTVLSMKKFLERKNKTEQLADNSARLGRAGGRRSLQRVTEKMIKGSNARLLHDSLPYVRSERIKRQDFRFFRRVKWWD